MDEREEFRLKYLLLLRNRNIHRYYFMFMERKKRKYRVRDIYLERETNGEFYLLVNEMRINDDELFFKSFRMSPSTFEKLCDMFLSCCSAIFSELVLLQKFVYIFF